MLNLIDNEVKVLEYWKVNEINKKARERNRHKKKFYFLDGPPYVTGDLHPGQMWVKTVKDVTLRYRRSKGLNVRDRAGYDVHGLPIENKVEKLLNVNSKREIETNIGIENFVKKCREYADSFMGRMDKDYERFGISLDFTNPYLAYRNEFIETGWSMLKVVYDKGLLYSGDRTTAFCTHCGTALAQGSVEVEYKDTDDPSIYVTFQVHKKSAKTKIEIPEHTYLLIWTTTPWTLPANVAVAAHPKELYVLVHANGKNLIIAKQRLDAVSAALNESFTVVSEFYGSELAGTMYVSPLESKVPKQKELREFHKVVLAEELVTMTDGSGLVHMAPGHGLEDYLIGKKNGLPIFSPVDMNGEYNKDAGEYIGIKVPGDANKIVMDDLHKSGALLAKSGIHHSYPHCWRCDTKLIYIATTQWFFNIENIKKKLKSENKKTIWHPAEAQGWMESVLDGSPDWCISRQRYWGIPLPIWKCSKCDNLSVIGSVNELKEKAINKDYILSMNDLHRPYIDKVKLKCDKCQNEMNRIIDIADVWYDASIAFRASLTEEEFKNLFPMDYIIEGKDQLRGWFSGLLKVSVLAYGKRPFKHIGIDGMLLDEKGKEMHRKLGNYVPLENITKEYGADTFRLWCASHTPWLDMNLNTTEIKDSGRTIMILYNVSNLIAEYESALNYVPKLKKSINPAKLDSEDAWIISRLESTISDVTGYYDNYEAFNAANALKRFIADDFSRFYLKLAKKSILYGSKKKAKNVLNVINYILYKATLALSPITPFVAESIYQERYKTSESIFLERWPKPNQKAINKELEDKMAIVQEAVTAILNSREKAAISLRWPIAKATLEVTEQNVQTVLQMLSGIVEDCVNAKTLDIKLVAGMKKEVRPLFAKLGPDFKEKASAVANALKAADADEISKGINANGYYSLHTDKGTFDIKPEHFTTVQTVEEGDSVSFKSGRAYVDKEISKELKDEALMREFERRIQMIRKEMKLKKKDKVIIYYEGVGEIMNVIKDNSKAIAKNVGASKFTKGADASAALKEIDIEGEIVKITVKLAETTA